MGRDDDARAAWSTINRLFLSHEVHDRIHDAVAAVELPHPGALKVLLGLDPADPPPMRAVAQLLRCDASYVTTLVDTLEDAGYVERRPAPGDRRVKLLVLTPQGEAAQAKATDLMSEPPAGFARLSAAEVRALARILAKTVDDEPFPRR